MIKILLIEDDPATRDSTSILLKREDFKVIEAADGLEGIRLAVTEQPDIVISDWIMPRMSGDKVLKELRSRPDTAHIPFIFLTARAAPENRRLGMGAGADDYLQKPFEFKNLLSTIHSRLARTLAYEAKAQKRVEGVRATILGIPSKLRTYHNQIINLLTLVQDELEFPPSQNRINLVQEYIADALAVTQQVVVADRQKETYIQLQLLVLDPNKQKTTRENFSVRHAKEIIEARSRGLAKVFQKEQNLFLDIESASLQISQAWLSKLVDELIGNSLKFSVANTPIQVTGKNETKNYSLAVSNYGEVPTASQLKEIEAYATFHSNPDLRGLGLGLAICKLIVEVFQGEIFFLTQGDQFVVKVLLRYG